MDESVRDCLLDLAASLEHLGTNGVEVSNLHLVTRLTSGDIANGWHQLALAAHSLRECLLPPEPEFGHLAHDDNSGAPPRFFDEEQLLGEFVDYLLDVKTTYGLVPVYIGKDSSYLDDERWATAADKSLVLLGFNMWRNARHSDFGAPPSKREPADFDPLESFAGVDAPAGYPFRPEDNEPVIPEPDEGPEPEPDIERELSPIHFGRTPQ